jgi:hypothetical protein
MSLSHQLQTLDRFLLSSHRRWPQLVEEETRYNKLQDKN